MSHGLYTTSLTIYFLLKSMYFAQLMVINSKFSTGQKIKFPFSLPPTVSLFFQLTRKCIWTKSAHKTIGHERSQRRIQTQINYFIVAARRKKSARDSRRTVRVMCGFIVGGTRPSIPPSVRACK
jgi:dipeptide/tripeptide permease